MILYVRDRTGTTEDRLSKTYLKKNRTRLPPFEWAEIRSRKSTSVEVEDANAEDFIDALEMAGFSVDQDMF